MITADEIRSRLAIDRSRLDDELELHSQVAEQISQKVASLEREVAHAKDDLQRCEAGLTLDFNNEEGKQTVAEVAARVVRDSRRRECLSAHIAFTEQLSTWKGLQDAWRDKKFSMRTFADLYVANYFDSGSALRQRQERTEERDTSYRDKLPRAQSTDAPRRRRMSE